jgi:hypothetical protein
MTIHQEKGEKQHHFRLEYISEKTGKLVRNPEISYCGKSPAENFDYRIINEGYWCKDCMKIFEDGALGAISEVVGFMSNPSEAN